MTLRAKAVLEADPRLFVPTAVSARKSAVTPDFEVRRLLASIAGIPASSEAAITRNIGGLSGAATGRATPARMADLGTGDRLPRCDRSRSAARPCSSSQAVAEVRRRRCRVAPRRRRIPAPCAHQTTIRNFGDRKRGAWVVGALCALGAVHAGRDPGVRDAGAFACASVGARTSRPLSPISSFPPGVFRIRPGVCARA